MKKLVILVSVLFVLSFVVAGIAAEKTKSLTGEVTNVDQTAKTITVKGKKAEETFDVAEAKFKGYKDLSEVATGDKVKVSYVEKEGKKVAKTVAKVSAAKPAEKPAAKPAEPPKK